MLGGVTIFAAFAPNWCFSVEAVNHLCPLNKPKKDCIRSCDTNNFIQSYKKVPPCCNWKSILSLWWKNKLGAHLSRSVLLIWLHSFSHFPGMQDLWIISFFIFSHEVSHHNVRKVTHPNFCKYVRGLGLEGLKAPKIRFLGIWQKSYPFRYAYFLQHKVPIFFCTFCQSNMFSKIWFLSYDPKTSECRIL